MGTSVLIIDDEEKLRGLLSRIISLEGYDVLQAANLDSARAILANGAVNLILCDVKLPDGNGVDFTKEVVEKYPHIPIILLTAYGNIPDGVQATRNGAFDYIVKGDDNDKIIPLLSQAVQKITAAPKIKTLAARSNGQRSFSAILGESDEIRSAIALAQKVAPLDTAVLLTGETGTGKEVFAQTIHYNSVRKSKPFVAINCSAFGRELLESELFGHKAGAFTSAEKDKKGLLDEAEGGTLFLDEIGDMPPELQPKLLRVLEDGTYYPVGDTKQRKASVRIIAATNRALDADKATTTFRADLYYRLAIFTIELPPLRERIKDIGLLADFFLALFAGKMGKHLTGISKDAMAALQHHEWKGNIRELKNVMERATILEDGAIISLESLPVEVRDYAQAGAPVFHLATAEKEHIRKVLAATGGNKAEAARLLNIGIATLYRKVEEYGLKEQ